MLVQLPLPGESLRVWEFHRLNSFSAVANTEKSGTLLKVFVITVLLFVFRQPLTVDIHYYYILELSFYLSLLLSQITDIRRKVRMIRTTDRRVSVKRTSVRQPRSRVDARKSCSAHATELPYTFDCPSLFLLSPQLRYVYSAYFLICKKSLNGSLLYNHTACISFSHFCLFWEKIFWVKFDQFHIQ